MPFDFQIGMDSKLECSVRPRWGADVGALAVCFLSPLPLRWKVRATFLFFNFEAVVLYKRYYKYWHGRGSFVLRNTSCQLHSLGGKGKRPKVPCNRVLLFLVCRGQIGSYRLNVTKLVYNQIFNLALLKVLLIYFKTRTAFTYR